MDAMGAAAVSPQRLVSLDVFRGLTVAAMILVNNPGSWAHLYGPLAHAPWHGVTFTDLVFPFFLFAVGNALALAMAGMAAQPASAVWAKVARRTAIIFALGLLLNAAPFVRWDAAGELVLRDWAQLRVMGVLQRIALCFGAAAVIVRLCGERGVPGAIAALLLGYWAACVAFAAPGAPAEAYSLQGWFGTAVDRALLGAAHLYRGEGVPFDPEGLASTPPAIAQVLLGWWVGRQLLQRGAGDGTLLRLLGAALLLFCVALVWAELMPLNKKIWTSSYVLHTTALAIVFLVALLWWLERPGRPAWSTAGWVTLGQAFGRNALFVFVLSGLVPRVLGLLRWQVGTAADGSPLWTSPLPWVYRNVFAGLAADPRLGSLAFAVANLSLYALLAWWLQRRRIFISV